MVSPAASCDSTMILPSTLMVPSFMTWKSTSKSMVSSRKAVSVISFSGSSWNGWYQKCQSASNERYRVSYLAFQQISYLLLYAFCLSKQAFFDAQPLKPALATPYIVHPRCAILYRSSEKVLSVCLYVVPLRLNCCEQSACYPSSHILRTRFPGSWVTSWIAGIMSSTIPFYAPPYPRGLVRPSARKRDPHTYPQ